MKIKYTGQKIRVVTAEIRRGGRYLITQRLPTSTLPMLWECALFFLDWLVEDPESG